MRLRQLFPVASDDPDLAALYAYPGGGWWLRANMVSTADGAASLAGVTAGISSDADRQVFALLRALADVIVVGAATVREEKYKPARVPEAWRDLRKGRAPTPPIAVVSARLDLDPEGPLIAGAPPHARTIVITTGSAPPERRAAAGRTAEVIVAGEASVDLKSALESLAERGHRRILTEGGPHLLAQLAGAALLDELCLTVSPLLAGPGAGRITTGGLPMPGGVARRFRLAHALADDSYLICRYVRQDAHRPLAGRPPAARVAGGRGHGGGPVSPGCRPGRS